ncbi:hypothetical protein ACWF94_21860 [Streptomyces sp. NPDC055078]
MTAPPPDPADQPRELTPECRLDACELCPGPGDIRLPWQGPAEHPVLTVRCTHDCHQSV